MAKCGVISGRCRATPRTECCRKPGRRSGGTRVNGRRGRFLGGSWSRPHTASARTPDSPAFFCAGGRHMCARDSAAEELDRPCSLAAFGQHQVEGFQTPERLSRQKCFQTLFHLPYSTGNARQVMLCTIKQSTVSRNLRSSYPGSPRLGCAASNTISVTAQSLSVTPVSMPGSIAPVSQ